MTKELLIHFNKDITLQWCPTDALTKWAHAHFYYLPESIAEGKAERWVTTMQAIMAELNTRGFKVELHSKKSTKSCK